MNESPDIEWLKRKWGLPMSATEAVARLLVAEAEGSTACVVDEPLPSWGGAAANPNEPGTFPLVVLRHRGRMHLQSRRFYEVEKAVGGRLRALSGAVAVPAVDSLDQLFTKALADDPQKMAARVALTRRLALITGGPGTGKTYTLARILALLVERGVPPGRIRLAAPTGKAADRMKKAVLESLDGLPSSFQRLRKNLADIAGSSATVHSLIGYNPGSGLARFDQRHPLACSVLIVDECSMLDALLWHALLAAMPPEGRLILLGDPNQLESVGQGNVFGELTRTARVSNSLFHSCHVHLTEARRFRERPAILEFARALEESDVAAAGQILTASTGLHADRGVVWIEMEEGALEFEDFPVPMVKALESVANAPTPQIALEALGKVCVLTAQREFFVGARAMSVAIEEAFAARQRVKNHPIIINRNDPETGLRNGSVGVIHVEEDGRRKAWFPSMAGSLQEFSVARLPDFSPAWAITIHRSQGSEYDDVLVVVPHEHSPLATRELLYTAITRARRNVFVAGTLSGVREAVRKPSNRTTLLSCHLDPGGKQGAPAVELGRDHLSGGVE